MTKLSSTYKNPAYKCYHGAKNRCESSKCPTFAYYGGRGIEFRFNSFIEFLAEIGERPSMSHTIERINNNGHYEKGNVRWATKKEQARNTRRNRLLVVGGETKSIAEWTEIYGLSSCLIDSRIRYGWCNDCAVLLKVGKICPHKPNNVRRGEEAGGAKLNEKKVRTIRKMREQGIIYTSIAKQFGVRHATIMAICNRQTWAHIE